MSEQTAELQDAAASEIAIDAGTALNHAALERNPGELASPLFRQFSGGAEGVAKNDIDMIMDIPVKLTVEIGRTRIAIKNLLQLAQGSVLELDSAAGEPLDILVNGCLIAQGEAVIVNEKLGIRLTDIVTPSERIRKLNR